MGIGGSRDALIALAVVVGADVEDGVVFAVVPSNERVVGFLEGEEIVLGPLLAMLQLGQQPRAGDDGMSLEEFHRRSGTHLAGDDALEILFDGQFVDGTDLVGLDDESE